MSMSKLCSPYTNIYISTMYIYSILESISKIVNIESAFKLIAYHKVHSFCIICLLLTITFWMFYNFMSTIRCSLDANQKNITGEEMQEHQSHTIKAKVTIVLPTVVKRLWCIERLCKDDVWCISLENQILILSVCKY